MTTRRTFLQGTAVLLAASPLRAVARAVSYDAYEKNIRTLQDDMAGGRTSAAELTQFYLDRIAAYDRSGPRLNAVLTLN